MTTARSRSGTSQTGRDMSAFRRQLLVSWTTPGSARMRGGWPGRARTASSRSGTRPRSRSEFDRAEQHALSAAPSPSARTAGDSPWPVSTATVRLLDGATGREMLTIFAHTSLVCRRGVQSRRPSARVRQLRSARSASGTPRLLASDPLAPQCVTLTEHKQQGFRRCLQPRWPLARLCQLGRHRQALGTYAAKQRRRGVVSATTERSLSAIPFADIAALSSAWPFPPTIEPSLPPVGTTPSSCGTCRRPEGDSLTERLTIPLAPTE